MDKIILDTNIFIKENFFHGKKIQSLLSLSNDERIELYITEITYNEIKSNFERFASKAISNHNKFRKESENWVIRNDSSLDKFFEKLDIEKIKSDFFNRLDSLIGNSIIKIISYREIDISSVFDKYFKNEVPFRGAGKKAEFPDAFSIEMIELFCRENSIRATVLSSDNDFLLHNSENFTVRNDYDKYLEEKYTELENVKKNVTEFLFNSNKLKIEQDLIEWYKTNLDDFSLYYSAVNGKDVYEVNFDEVLVDEMKYRIIKIDAEVVTIEVNAEVLVKVQILTDDEEYMYYDDEDKSYNYYETSYESFQKKFDASMTLSTDIYDETDHLDNFEVESINEDKEISFDIEYDYR